MNNIRFFLISARLRVPTMISGLGLIHRAFAFALCQHHQFEGHREAGFAAKAIFCRFSGGGWQRCFRWDWWFGCVFSALRLCPSPAHYVGNTADSAQSRADARGGRAMPTLNWIGKDAVEHHHAEVPSRLVHCDGDLSAGDPDAGNLFL